MTILWWLPELPPDPGGIGTFAGVVGPELARRGHDLYFLVTWGGPSHDVLEGIPTQRIPVREQLGEGPAAIIRHRAAVATLKREVRPSLYHVHVCEPSPVLHVSTITSSPAPTMLTLHNEMAARLHTGGHDTLLGRLAELSTVVAAVSSESADDFISQRPDLAHRVVVVPNGVPIGPPPPPVPAAPTIVAVGRLTEQKGFDRLLRAMPAVVAAVPGATLTVVGDGPDRDDLERLAAELFVAVTFTGHVDRTRVPRYFEQARVVAAPSRYEGMPYVVLEAGERGRAVVGTDIGGIREVIADGDTGLLVPDDTADADPAPLAAALVRLLTEPGLAERQGAAARTRIVDRFSVAACAETYDTLYRVADPGPRPRVSVVIPAWNAERFIGDTIASVRAQTFRDVEIIVVDDGSTDGTVAAARAVGDDVVVLRQPHRHMGPSRNAGLAIARGELVAHLDADDLWPPDRLERLVAVLDADPTLDAVFGQVVEFADPDAPANLAVRTEPHHVRLLTTGLARRAVHDTYGPFRPERVGDQIHWVASATHRGLRYTQIDDVVMHRRIHSANNSHRVPFLADTGRLDLLRGLLRERRAPDRDAPS